MTDMLPEKTTKQQEQRTERRHPRHPYTGPVAYRELGPTRMGRIRNLSQGGVMVELAELHPPGTAFDLVIHLDQRSIHPQAEVIWSQNPSDGAKRGYLHGLRFTRLDLQDRLTLELFVALAFDEKEGDGEGG